MFVPVRASSCQVRAHVCKQVCEGQRGRKKTQKLKLKKKYRSALKQAHTQERDTAR
jgi:hypothetical protein